MSLKKIPYRQLFFSLGCIVTFLFLLWSSLILISLLLLFVLDSLTLQTVAGYLKKRTPHKLFQILKYVYGLVAVVFIVILIRIFVCDIYFVPSSSMEKTLYPGNYILVNKLSYGVKIPAYFVDVPVIGSIFKNTELSTKHNRFTALKAFKKFERTDIVVFKSVEKKNNLLIKRLIGMPGDTLKIVNSVVYVNGEALPEMELVSYCYLDSLGRIKTYTNKEFDMLAQNYKSTLQKMVATKFSKSKTIFPFSKQEKWTLDNYGPIVIPKKGMSVLLNKENRALYKYCIRDYENELEIFSSNTVSNYTFKNDYYFVLGDNRHKSVDSRMYGFIPESYIQGKMTAVLYRKE